jgi:NAD(P)-dependent dehydrogenase (short-subunit alcohol dehydrogenase family)
MKTVVVTGASTGIGHASAKVLVGEGFRVFGSVRKQADADRLKAELGENFSPLLFDVTDEAAVHVAARQVRAALAGETLLGLLNNAGVAVPGPLYDQAIEDFRRQMEINLTGQLIVTQAFLPLLGMDSALKGPPGRIVMISSVGGKRAAPFMGAYNASKFALEGLSESLRRELMLYDIDVIVIGPGMVQSAIWDKVEALDIDRYRNSSYYTALQRMREFMLRSGRRGLRPEQVAELVHRILTTSSPKVRYAIVDGRIEHLMMKVIPSRLVDRIIAYRLGFKRKDG